MKLKFITMFLIILNSMLLFSETIVDSVYSDPVLDGYIMFSQNAQGFSVNNWMYSMSAGDTHGPIPFPDPNSYFRSYISFVLPEIPIDFHIDSVYVRLYQYQSGGYNAHTGEYTDFPVWDFPGGGGDTIKCVLSHIDFGNELDIGDWEKGDVGNTYTYQNNIGTITESGEVGYRYLDITSSVILDYDLNRTRTQHRISFQIDNDWDYESDLVSFISGTPPIDEYTPIVYFIFSDEVNSIENEEIPLAQTLDFEIYPNPVNNILGISLSSRDVLMKGLEIYNIKGQKVKSLYNYDITNGTRISIDSSTLSSGIYLMKLITDKEVALKKFLKMN